MYGHFLTKKDDYDVNTCAELVEATPSMAHVYIFEAETGLIKIGYTINPEQRVKKIQTSSGFKITQQFISPLCSNYREVERNLHKQFADHRHQGEWFAIEFQTAVEALNQRVLEKGSSRQLVAFQFHEQRVRVFLDEKSEPLFCLKDTCDVLEIKNSRDVVKRLNKNGIKLVDTECDVDPVYATSSVDTECDICPVEGASKARKTQTMSFINEPNLYRVIFRSDKLVAVRFQDWVFEEVLPAIRKTGKYEVTPSLPAATRRPEYQDFDAFVAECFVADSAGLVSARNIYAAYKDWCKRHQRPVYSHKLLGQYLKEMGYVPTKRAHGLYCWLGVELQTQQVLGNKVADLRNCLSLLHRVVEKDEQLPRDEALILIKLALEKSKDLD